MQFNAAAVDLVTYFQEYRRLPHGRGARVSQLCDASALLPPFVAGESVPCCLPTDPQRRADFLPCHSETAGQLDFKGKQAFCCC